MLPTILMLSLRLQLYFLEYTAAAFAPESQGCSKSRFDEGAGRCERHDGARKKVERDGRQA